MPQFGNLVRVQMLADCTLVCAGGHNFSAHRAILAAKSPVFAAMFENEKSSDVCACRISDIRADVLDAMLQYVYTRGLTKAEGKLEALWFAADTYDIQDLKMDCERLILETMANDNALAYLTFAAPRGLNKIVVEAAKVIAHRHYYLHAVEWIEE